MLASPISKPQPKSIYEVFQHFSQEPNATNALIVDVLLSEDLTNHYFSLLISSGDFVSIYPTDEISRPALARGAALFFALHRLLSSPDEHRDYSLIDRIVRDQDFIKYFCEFHEIPNTIGLRSLAFVASGTTSFIFKVMTQRYGSCALKVIQASYARMPSIREATSAYSADYGIHIKHSPRIHDSFSTWIFMEYIEGVNLDQYLRLLREEVPFLSDLYTTYVGLLFHMIAEALSYYECLQPSLIHGDLTPFNIMVLHDNLQPLDVKLIDFGPNYVLKDRVGSRRIFVEAFSRTELFTAPEVVSGKNIPSFKSDLYSLGMIGLDLLCEKPLKKDAVGVRLREIWQNPASVGVAQIIEDLVDSSPENRALILKRGRNQSVYSSLDKALQEQVEIYKELVVGRGEDLNLQAQAKSKFTPDVWRVANNIRLIFSAKDNTYNNVTKLQRVAADLNVILQTTIVFSFVLYTCLDIKAAFLPNFDIPFSQAALQGAMFLPKNFTIGDFQGNLPGRCVAVTFGLIAARYYANIFAALRVDGLDNIKQGAANALLRLNSFSYFVPIMAAIVYDPKLWPFCAFAGTLFPAINNLFCWSVARDACKRTRHVFSIEAYHQSETERFLRIYREWWLLMGSYSLGIGAIGILLFTGTAHDEVVYAVAVCFVNIFKIYRNNCAGEAPFIAGNLSRLFFSIRRLSAIKGGDNFNKIGRG